MTSINFCLEATTDVGRVFRVPLEVERVSDSTIYFKDARTDDVAKSRYKVVEAHYIICIGVAEIKFPRNAIEQPMVIRRGRTAVFSCGYIRMFFDNG